jgi:flagellar hook-associated protein 3 FlgL
MRVTPLFQSAQSVRFLQAHQTQINKFTEQISTGKKLTRPSDDPTDTAIVRRNKAEDSLLGSRLENIRDASFVIERQVSTMSSIREVLTRATQIAIEVNDGSKDTPSSEVAAVEIEELLDRVLLLANETLSDGRSLFAGTATDQTAFAATRDASGQISQVSYQGSLQSSEVVIGRSKTVPTFISGKGVFQARDRQTTLFHGVTGAAAGSGTSTATGLGKLIVRNQTTTYDAASGVAASAVNGDTLDDLRVGPHTFTVSGGGTTVQLNNGAAVAHGGSNDFALSDLDGNLIRIDASGALTDGTYTIYRGEVSVDDGVSFAAISSNDQAFTNSLTGEINYIDTTGIRQDGTDLIDNEGSYDIFESLIALRDTIRNEQGVIDSARSDYLSRIIGDLNRIRDAVVEPLGVQSAHAEHLRTLSTRYEDVQFRLTEETDSLESANLPEAIVGLQTSQNFLQASLSVTARLNSLSLVDFLA